MSELDDATVEAIAEALEPYDIPTGSWTAAERLEPARAVAAALPDPRPTEAEVRQAWESRIRDADFWQELAALGCFRPAATTVPAEATNVDGRDAFLALSPQEDRP